MKLKWPCKKYIAWHISHCELFVHQKPYKNAFSWHKNWIKRMRWSKVTFKSIVAYIYTLRLFYYHYRFVDDLPSGWLFIFYCFLIRIITAVGSSMSATASLSILTVTFRNHIGTVFVSKTKCSKENRTYWFLLLYWQQTSDELYFILGNYWNIHWSWFYGWSCDWWCLISGMLPTHAYVLWLPYKGPINDWIRLKFGTLVILVNKNLVF